MKLVRYLMMICLAVPSLSWGALNLPAPKDLLAKATQSRVALREVILDMDLNIPEMRDPATFEGYFFLLDDLQRLSIKFNLNDYYPQAVEGLGLRMAANGMRWLDVTRVTPEKTAFYVKWMDGDNLSRLLGMVEYQLESVTDKTALMNMARNIEFVLPIIDRQAASLPYVQMGFRRLLSDAAVTVLKAPNLTVNEVEFWIAKIRLSSSAAEYMDYLNMGIYSLNSANKDMSHEYLDHVLKLTKQLNNLSETVPSWLANSVADATVELLLRMVKLEEQFYAGEFEGALASLRIRQMQSLILQWMTQEKLPGKDYVFHYLALSRVLVERARDVGLGKDADELAKWLSRAAAPILAKQQDLEGRYELYDQTGRKYFFTIATARENVLIAALGDATGAVYKPFFNVTYDVNGGFVASEREPDLDHDQNHPVKFEMDSDGVLTVVDLFSRRSTYILKGKKVKNLPDVWSTALPNAPRADGFYEGNLTFPDGQIRKVRVIVTSFNGYTLGRLDSEDGLTVDFNIGSRGNDGTLLLTSGRSSGGTWVQLRANVTTEGLMTYVLIGARHETPKPSLLKRVAK